MHIHELCLCTYIYIHTLIYNRCADCCMNDAFDGQTVCKKWLWVDTFHIQQPPKRCHRSVCQAPSVANGRATDGSNAKGSAGADGCDLGQPV